MNINTIYIAIHKVYDNTNIFFTTKQEASEYINSRPFNTIPIEWRIVKLYEKIPFEADMSMTTNAKIFTNKSTQTEHKFEHLSSHNELHNIISKEKFEYVSLHNELQNIYSKEKNLSISEDYIVSEYEEI